MTFSRLFIPLLLLILFYGCIKDKKTFKYILAGDSSSQGVIHHLINDTFGVNKTLKIEVDNNGNNDLEFRSRNVKISGVTSRSLEISGLDNTYIAIQDDLASIYNQNDSIGNNLEWKKGRFFLYQTNGGKGLWKDAKSKYLAFKTYANNNIYYGWIRLDIGEKNMVYEYALRQ